MRNEKITEALKKLWGIKTNKELAVHLEVSKQSMNAFDKGATSDIKTKIIVKLLGLKTKEQRQDRPEKE